MLNVRLTVSILILWIGVCFGQVSIESKVDKAKIKIGDRITYSIIIKHGENVKIELPEAGENLGAFEILGYNDTEPTKDKDNIVQVREYTISTFDVGEFEIPPVTVRFSTTEDTTWQQMSTEKIKIEVESLKPSEEGDIKDIKLPLELERDYAGLIRLIAGIVAVILLAVLIYYFIKRRKEGKSLLPIKEKPPRPPHEIALEELDKLVNSDMLAEGKVKQFYIQLSEIIRVYIEGRFHIVALEMTTFEIIANMKQADIEKEIVELVTQFLEGSDLVKFAKYLPTEQENETAIHEAYEIVNSTKIEIQTEYETNGDLKKQQQIDKPIETEETEPDKSEDMVVEKEVE